MAYPIYPGMDVKFQVTAQWPDFRMTEDPFEITIKDRYGRTVKVLQKDDCFWDSDGRYYFTIENVRRGIYYAYFRGDYEDEDYDDQRAAVTDMQELLTVPGIAGDCPCEGGRKSLYCKYHKVRYMPVTTVSIDGDDYLCGSDGRYILTSDGKRICFRSDKRKQIEDMGKVILETMTGEEFKKLIEGKEPNEQVNTIPELMDVMRGISDDTTVIDEIEVQQEENEASDEDIDSIFDAGADDGTGYDAGGDDGGDDGEEDI